jgi:DNA-directed RNA polymerase subunit H (RpoH/RPB5)
MPEAGGVRGGLAPGKLMLKQIKYPLVYYTYMSLSSNRILSIYKSRNTLIKQLETLEYEVADYAQFSINEIDAMCANDQLDMLVSREKDGGKIYVKYCIHIKQLRKENIDQFVEDLFDIEQVLEKKDILVVVTNDDPNDTILQKLKYLYDHSGILVVVRSLQRLQFNILEHDLVPPATILNKQEIEAVKNKYHVEDVAKFPEISRFDPQALALCLRPGDVIRLERNSNTALYYNYYRTCV